jgi:hypothetical protein
MHYRSPMCVRRRDAAYSVGRKKSVPRRQALADYVKGIGQFSGDPQLSASSSSWLTHLLLTSTEWKSGKKGAEPCLPSNFWLRPTYSTRIPSHLPHFCLGKEIRSGEKESWSESRKNAENIPLWPSAHAGDLVELAQIRVSRVLCGYAKRTRGCTCARCTASPLASEQGVVEGPPCLEVSPCARPDGSLTCVRTWCVPWSTR